MYTTIFKQQEGCTFKDSHPKCFITTNFDNSTAKLSPGAVNRGDVLTACFRDIQSQRSIRMEFVIIMIWLLLKQGIGNRGKESGNGEWGMRNGKTRNTKSRNL